MKIEIEIDNNYIAELVSQKIAERIVAEHGYENREAGIGIKKEVAMDNYYRAKGTEIGALVDRKNKQYGNSFNRAGDILTILYPDGVNPDQYRDMLAVVRVVDKLFRVAHGKQGDEDPWQDIAGYGLLGMGVRSVVNRLTKYDLQQYRWLMKNIDRLEEHLLVLDTEATRVTTRLHKEPGGSSRGVDKLSGLVAQITDTKALINDQLVKAYEIRVKIETAISKLPGIRSST